MKEREREKHKNKPKIEMEKAKKRNFFQYKYKKKNKKKEVAAELKLQQIFVHFDYISYSSYALIIFSILFSFLQATRINKIPGIA